MTRDILVTGRPPLWEAGGPPKSWAREALLYFLEASKAG